MGIGTLVIGAVIAPQLLRFAVPWQYRDLFVAIGQNRGVSPDLLHALALHESKLNPSAISPPNKDGSRDYGLMQINEQHFTSFGLTAETALDAQRNVDAAARLLASIQKSVGSNIADVISVYNAGPSKLGARPKLTAAGTYINMDYVRSVLSYYWLIRAASIAPIQKV